MKINKEYNILEKLQYKIKHIYNITNQSKYLQKLFTKLFTEICTEITGENS